MSEMTGEEIVERARIALGAPAGAASVGPIIVNAHQLAGQTDATHDWWSEVYNPTCLTVMPPDNDPAPIAFRSSSGQLSLYWRGFAGWAFFVQIFADSNAMPAGYKWYWADNNGGEGSGDADQAGGYWYFTTGPAEPYTEMSAYFTAQLHGSQTDESEWWLAKAAWVAIEIAPPE